MSFGSQINYKRLLERHGRIQIPMIQRDYAQGRPAETEVREEFLITLKGALDKPADHPGLPLNLDFVYGSVEGDEETCFLPLDGQQRLTTLFLLHWYLAWKDNQWTAFEQLFLSDGHSRFAYNVRPSSNEFFDQLVGYRPDRAPEDVPDLAAIIADQSWYFRSWRLDPTIQAVLHMLNAIHDKFCESNGLFSRLLDENQPAITFQLLDLENFGLSDDLYIKMNARGKPLTAFETFKARYEQELANQLRGETYSIGGHSFCAAEYIARRMDTTWADLLWNHRNTGSDLYDEAFMNVFRAVALITRSPESTEYRRDFAMLRTGRNPPSYTDFHSNGWLDEQFTRTLVCLLDAWCYDGGTLCQLLPDGRYLDEAALFGKIVSNGANLSYTDLVQFTAYAQFIERNQADTDPGAFQEWMRIIRNLAVNTGYNRADDFRRSVRGLVGMLEHSGDVLGHFAKAEKAATGFSEPQTAEERLKAQLILAHEGWRGLVDRAEGHGYFRGQIGFLLDFAGVVASSSESVPESWDASDHVGCQKAFARHLELAEEMFSVNGLTDAGEHLWQRALLSLGDYLLPSGRNHSFLVNSMTEEASWKRLLSGSGNRGTAERNILKRLFNGLSPETDISEQLDVIIERAENLDPWREAVVRCPSVLDYCERNLIRMDESGLIYLLKRSQMNGAHAELFTFCLCEKLQSGEVSLSSLRANYESVNDTYSEPHIWLYCNRPEPALRIEIENQADEFLVKVSVPGNDTALAELFAAEGFYENGCFYQKIVQCADIEEFLRKLDVTINTYLGEVDDV